MEKSQPLLFDLEDLRPDKSHESYLVGASYDHRTIQSEYTLTFRPALHGLLDLGVGYTPFSSAVMLQTALSYGDLNNDIRLNELILTYLGNTITYDRITQIRLIYLGVISVQGLKQIA